MDDAELQRLTRAVQGHRTRAALARDEAAARGPNWWGYLMLQQSAEYYERRAQEMERHLQGLADLGDADRAPPGQERP